MTTRTKRPSRADRAADQAATDPKPADQPTPETPDPEPTPGPEPTPEPKATLDLGRYPYYMHKPTVTGPDGTEHKCPHRDGHTKESDALKCARKLASQAGLTL